MMGVHFNPFCSYGGCLLLCVLLGSMRGHLCCYSCLIPDEDGHSLCDYMQISGKMATPEECEETIRGGFKPLEDTLISYRAIGEIQRYLTTFDWEVRLIDVLLLPELWRNLLQKKMDEYVEGVRSIASSHPYEACRPPCGFQKQAQRYNCSECTMWNCDLPVACEIEDIQVMEGQPTHLSCDVNFTLPAVFSTRWMFGKKFRVMDLDYFDKIEHRPSLLLNLKIFFTGEDDFNLHISYTRRRHQGTYLCEIEDHVGDILVQKFYFVKVLWRGHAAALRWMEYFQRVVAPGNYTWPERRKKAPRPFDIFDLKGYLDQQTPLSATGLIFVTIIASVLGTLITVMCSFLVLRRKEI